MTTVFRTAAVYVLLLVTFRLLGRRSLAQITMFDFALLLIISETTQQAMTADDGSITGCMLCVLTLVVLDLALSLLKGRFPRFARQVEGLPLVVVEDGVPLRERMRAARIDEDDVLTAARASQGVGRMDQIQYAVLERSGGISVIPRETSGNPSPRATSGDPGRGVKQDPMA
jgi:uncharacterized membrane protein YcaP (DUF421 family)